MFLEQEMLDAKSLLPQASKITPDYFALESAIRDAELVLMGGDVRQTFPNPPPANNMPGEGNGLVLEGDCDTQGSTLTQLLMRQQVMISQLLCSVL